MCPRGMKTDARPQAAGERIEMKSSIRLAAPLLALAVCAAPALSMSAQPYGPSGPVGYYQDHPGWDMPPAEFHEIARRGFHDGLDAARHDMEAHRRLDVYRHPMYRRPPVPFRARVEYRRGFARGYDVALRHAGMHGYRR